MMAYGEMADAPAACVANNLATNPSLNLLRDGNA
jgi:hypothetical protein